LNGAAVVNRFSVDLKAEFLNMGLSPRNLWNVKRYYEDMQLLIQNCDKP
jgi:hypothetical protein